MSNGKGVKLINGMDGTIVGHESPRKNSMLKWNFLCFITVKAAYCNQPLHVHKFQVYQI